MRIEYLVENMIWKPIRHPELDFGLVQKITDRLESVLQSWRGTPYSLGQQCKGVAVDCVRFVCAVLDEMYQQPYQTIDRLPDDIAFHSRERAIDAFRMIMRLYPDHTSVKTDEVEPGDVLICGSKSGGPGHAMIAGTRQSILWHSNSHEVVQTGLAFPQAGMYHLHRVLRANDKRKWLECSPSQS